MAKIDGKWFVENIDNSNKYRLEEVPVASLGDYERKLYRVSRESDDSIHYKGISASRSRITEDQNRGLTIDDTFKIGEHYIENALIDGDEDNVEFVLHSKREFKRSLVEDGSYLPEIIKNVRIANLANPYSRI